MRESHLILVCIITTAIVSGCLSNLEETGETKVPEPSPTFSDIGSENEIEIPWVALPDDFRKESEAKEYQNISLTPIFRQGNNAINKTQHIDVNSYQLQVEGLVDRQGIFTYNQLIAYPPTSKVVSLNCVEGWSFTAKWTGVPLETLLNVTGIKDNATEVIFYSSDGYSTSHKLAYLLDNNIILAYKLNDVTLPDERGFPLQLVAEDKFGYKWAKWIIRIELAEEPYEGYWESRGYSNNAEVGGPAFE
ncbi:MAG: oxidoreductase [ANME-2 cluster archaeon]|nr:MAG: oxidoreductase [ANME-2 cluster archaeon]